MDNPNAQDDRSHLPLPACPLCGGQQFRKEESRLESAWGFTIFRFRMLICEQCQHVLFFSKGRSIWDLDE